MWLKVKKCDKIWVKWLSGRGVPVNSLGQPGDLYYQTSNGQIWQKAVKEENESPNFRQG